MFSRNLDNYELLAGNIGDYGQEVLEYAGAGDETQEMPYSFTEFEAPFWFGVPSQHSLAQDKTR